eukprot:gene1501-12118_t
MSNNKQKTHNQNKKKSNKKKPNKLIIDFSAPKPSNIIDYSQHKTQTKKIKNIHIFDFDGTLIDTPNKEKGMKELIKAGKNYKIYGWWGIPESLSSCLTFGKGPAYEEIFKSLSDEENYVIMMTGRSEYLSSQVLSILEDNEMNPHRCIFKPNGVYDTLPYKLDILMNLQDEFKSGNFEL